METLIKKVETHNIAKFEKALIEAFELFKEVITVLLPFEFFLTNTFLSCDGKALDVILFSDE